MSELNPWEEWLSGRPEIIKEVAAKLPPDRLYKIKSTGQKCVIRAYAEDGTVRVLVPVELNRERLMVTNLEVFGLRPDDLEEVHVNDESV